MEISKTAIGALGAACLTVGLSGAYLMNRGTPATERPAQATSTAPATAGVDASEAVVSEPAAPAAPTATPQAPRPSEPARAARTATPPPSKTAAATRQASPATPADSRVPEPGRDARTQPAPAEPVAQAQVEAVPAVPPPPTFEELVLSADSVIGLQMETSVTSERARIEDQVVAQVTRDVKVGDRVAIPSGSKAYGEVTLVERGGRMRERARLGVRFTSIVLGDGTRVPIDSDVILREGSSPTGESSAKIGGGALGGAILGGILGGAKGAIIGGSAGAGAGTAAVMAGGRNAATLPSGAPVTVRLVKPATVTVDK